MYHIDGFVYKNELRILWPSKYINNCVDFNWGGFLASYSLQSTNSLVPRIRAFVKQILEAMDAPPSYAFHVEVWHTPDDQLVFCEAASRTGGAGVVPVTLELYNMNLNKAAVIAQCEDEVTAALPEDWTKEPTQCAGWIITYPQKGELLAIPSVCPFDYVLDFEPTQKRQFSHIEHCTDSLASFLIIGENEEQVITRIHQAIKWLNQNCKWKL